MGEPSRGHNMAYLYPPIGCDAGVGPPRNMGTHAVWYNGNIITLMFTFLPGRYYHTGRTILSYGKDDNIVREYVVF